ncbi:hypothetical protein V2J09_008404 [Rumex salicifolius]
MFYSAPISHRPEWRWSLMKAEAEFKIYRCRYNKNVVHCALVTRDNSVDINELRKNCIELQMLCPMEKISHTEEGVPMMTLLYRPFKTLDDYLSTENEGIEDPSFVGVMRRIVSSMNKLHDSGLAPWLPIDMDDKKARMSAREAHEDKFPDVKKVTMSVIVIQDNKEGGLLFVSTLKELEDKRSNLECQRDFVAIKKGISNAISKSKEKRNNLRPSKKVESLLRCMTLAKTDSQRRRLLLHPLFISPHEMVYSYVDTLYSSAWACRAFQKALRWHWVGGAIGRIKETKYPELKGLCSNHSDGIRNYFDMLHFIRNCVHHIQGEWTTECRSDTGACVSELILEPEKFLEEIERWYSGIMCLIMEVSYDHGIPGMIDILDQF